MIKNVLDHGSVELIDYMGNDYRVLQSARVSTGGVAMKGAVKDRGLIRYLYRNKHATPFESCVFTFRIQAPIFVARQWMRTRSASYNEFSARYSEVKDEFYIPKAMRKQGDKNHQGSGEDIQDNGLIHAYSDAISRAKDIYDGYIGFGVAREMARGILPVSQYTEFYFTINLRNLFHFLNLRLHAHAQYEIRVYAEAILDILKELGDFQWSVEIFEEMNEIENLVQDCTAKDLDGFKKYLQVWLDTHP